MHIHRFGSIHLYNAQMSAITPSLRDICRYTCVRSLLDVLADKMYQTQKHYLVQPKIPPLDRLRVTLLPNFTAI